ncbi:MAG: hypothetical protein LBH48_06300 [Bifidobacteriaceae bacterium]|jgi:hypothetical protein|nr:hypothetical protein [Bifidobacteriaceae bacterium]
MVFGWSVLRWFVRIFAVVVPELGEGFVIVLKGSRRVALLSVLALVFISCASFPSSAMGPSEDGSEALRVRVSVGQRVVKGVKSTGRYVPNSFQYNVTVPTLRGATAKAQRVFNRRIDALVDAELEFYAKGALTQDQFTTTKAKQAGGPETPVDEWLVWCHENFWDLTGKFTSAVYKERYASVVLTFSGLNAPCVGLGGMWPEYRSDRSVTIDTKTGRLKSLADFTSNAGGKVTDAVKAWYAGQSHEFLTRSPVVAKNLRVCDRPGNVVTVSPTQAPCYRQAYKNSGPVAWLVRDKGLRLTFPAGEGPRHATLKWSRIPKRL